MDTQGENLLRSLERKVLWKIFDLALGNGCRGGAKPLKCVFYE
jgi:hypothetical protein